MSFWATNKIEFVCENTTLFLIFLPDMVEVHYWVINYSHFCVNFSWKWCWTCNPASLHWNRKFTNIVFFCTKTAFNKIFWAAEIKIVTRQVSRSKLPQPLKTLPEWGEVSRGSGSDVELVCGQVVHEWLNQEVSWKVEDEAEGDGNGQRRQCLFKDGQ